MEPAAHPDEPMLAPYEPDRLVWGAIAAGVAPGIGLIVSLLCARFARAATRKKILALAGLDLLLAVALVFALVDGAPFAEAGLDPTPLLGIQMSTEPSTTGVLITAVHPSSPAESAGLVPGDTVVSIDGTPTDGVEQLQQLVADRAPETEIALTVRDNEGSLREARPMLATRWTTSARSTAFHDLTGTVVLGLAFMLILGLGAWGAFVSVPRWAGGGLLLLGAWGATHSFLLDVESHLVLAWIFVGAVIVFAAVLWWRMKHAAHPAVRRFSRTSRGFVVGLVAAGAWGVRATLAVYVLSVLVDVTPAATNAVMVAVGGSRGGSGGESVPFSQLLFAAALVIAAPIFEELFFRGALLPWLAMKMTPAKAIAVSAILFGALHIPSHGLHFIVATAYGAVLGWTWMRTRRLWPCMLIHALINAAATLRFFL